MSFPFWPSIFIILIPFIFLLSLLLLFYIIQWIFPSSFQALHNDGPRVIVGGTVARDAGLQGITTEERRMIIETILKPVPFRDQQRVTDYMSADEEEAKGSSVPMEASDGEIIFPENENRILSRCNSDGCPICFGVFESDDVVILGKYCTHMYHSSCLLEWLERHDICPYCRSNMITSNDMREAVFKVFGEKRAYQMLMGDPTTDAS